jgi:hypothetical protein
VVILRRRDTGSNPRATTRGPPVTGEVLVFRRTSEETNGEAVLVETIVRPDGFVAAAHVHP